ncbi:LytTR family DNA-binding domain-containing protein [Thioclava sp.]|uniref:LytTR family DNA-binding domain-containing protein n=1 Tax=Thioclava sp. TaxID=1933450 RepID=UPI003AA9B902
MSKFLALYRRLIWMPALGVVWVVASLFGIIAGPFGSAIGMSAGARALFWPLVIGAGILIGAAIRILLRRTFRLRNPWGEALLLATLIATCLSWPFYVLTVWLAHDPELPGFGVPHMASYIFGLSIAISVLRHWLGPKRVRETAKPAALPRLVMRLEPDLRSPLVRLAVRDHYVDVVTQTGAASVLMRLADAIAETEGVVGLQVHRSHWVAHDGVQGQLRENGKVLFRTTDGALVPVSRTYLGAVEAAGFPAA